MAKFIVGITGASGSIYATELIKCLLNAQHSVLCTVTNAGKLVLKHEIGLDLTEKSEAEQQKALRGFFLAKENLSCYHIDNIAAPIASGSAIVDGMVVVPCSMGTLSGIKNGSSLNLLQRAADVMLKEQRKLVLVPREAPYNSIHLENMLCLSRQGVHIVPASPGFYAKPQTLQELVAYFVARLMDQMAIGHSPIQRWQGL